MPKPDTCRLILEARASTRAKKAFEKEVEGGIHTCRWYEYRKKAPSSCSWHETSAVHAIFPRYGTRVQASRPLGWSAGFSSANQRMYFTANGGNCPEGDECFGTRFSTGRSSPGPRLQCDSGPGSGLPSRRRSRMHYWCTQPQFELPSPIADSTQSCGRTLATSCSPLSISTADISFIAAVSSTFLAVVLSRLLVAVFQDSARCGEGELGSAIGHFRPPLNCA